MEAWSRIRSHQGPPKWTKTFLSSKQMTRGSPKGLDQLQRGQCPSQLRGQSGDSSVINSGPKPSLSRGSQPLSLGPKIPGMIWTWIEEWEMETK